VYADAADIEARGQMLVAAAMGAVAFQKGLGATHAVSHSVGAIYNTHHGMTNAVVLPSVITMNRPAIESRVDDITRYLGIANGFDGFTQFIMTLRESLGVPERLRDMGVGTDRIEEMTRMALEDPSAGGNPVKMTAENTRALFEACI
jgi:alcohol dehydrogenase class IV